jgi:peptidoglycan/xylan/chitin deacetylase (PgdA/CDA1 family)
MFSGIGSIFMLHRIAPYEKGKLIHNENLKIAPDELENIIKVLKRKKIAFLSLDEVVEVIQKGKAPKHKFVIFTLDDGYKDNLQFGYPVFKAHNIPLCIYITNSFPNQTTNLWWFAMEHLILKNRILITPDLGSLKNISSSDKKKNFLKLRSAVLEKHYKDPIAYFQQSGDFDFDIIKERNEKCLMWEEIKKLSADPLVTIGCHTVNHYPLSKLPDQEVEFEISISKKELEERLQKPIKHFAFPFGSTNEAYKREYKIAKSAGFDSITTTLHGSVHLNDDLQSLNRVFLFPFPEDSSLRRRELFWNLKSVYQFIKKVF